MTAGVVEQCGRRWFHQAGGVLPPRVPEVSSGRYLSMTEREEIFAGVERGDSIRGIADALGRAPSTVLRELRHNMRHQLYRTRSPFSHRRTETWNYRPSAAQERMKRLASRPKTAKLAKNAQLRELVQAKLVEKLSPEQISRQLRRQFPDDAEMRVSHETIYQSIYVQGRGALRRELAVCLRTGRALRRPHRKGQERRGRIPNMINISERPAEVEDRAVPGHWEGDLIIGKHGRSAIGTLVERKTRYLILLHLPNGQRANHAKISVATNLEIYFCDPAKPWQRGSNENTNGLLRQYFPKGTDLSVHSPEHLEFVSAQMNRRPRKTLNWLEPREVLAQLLSQAPRQPAVASTD
ncbi:MAG: IS30 family transposase [Chloroflexi bacterium]|nr:MAG: IS30 family transposase [Chloroflexota bacterium]